MEKYADINNDSGVIGKRSTNYTLVMIDEFTKDTFKFSGEGMSGETDKQTEILA